MQFIFKALRLCFFIVITVFIVTSCQNFPFKSKDTKSVDSVALAEELKVIIPPKPLLLDKWDSLNRNLLVFTIDTLNPVSIKDQKRQLRDSLKREFSNKPKHVYLTFDDGPLVGSFAIDSLATAKNVKLNTFLVGRHANMSKGRKQDFEKYVNNPLISCYNHSYTHANNRFITFYSNVKASYDDFVKNQEDLKLTKKIARLPGRNIWIYDDVRKIDLKSGSRTADSLFANGYKIFGWDVEWRIHSLSGVPIQSFDSTYGKMRNFMNNPIAAQTPNNVVLLMHDDMFQTKNGRKLLENLIDSLIKENYQFEFMEDYPIKY